MQDQSGGYAQLMVRVPGLGDQSLMPYVRAQYFDGGRKTESDAQHSLVTQYDVGVEWRPFPAFELTVEFTRSDRRNSDGASPREEVDGNRLGLQAQFNY